MDALIQDLRYALRAFRRMPVFALLAMLTVAAGVGASTAVFSVVNAVLLRPLPFERPDDLVLLATEDRQTKETMRNASPANFLDWRARQRSFTGIAAFRGTSFTTNAGAQPDYIDGAMVTAEFFDVLGVKATQGRTFQPADARPGAPRVAVIGDGAWRKRFGARPDVVGQIVRFNDEPHVIVGVIPSEIDFPRDAQVWLLPHWPVPDDPLQPAKDPSLQRGHGYLEVLARIKPGVARQQAQADLDAIASALEREYPDENERTGVRMTSLHEELVGDVRPTLVLLFAAVGLLLLIATANVAGLLIARAAGRTQEVALRLALGATRGRVVRQLITESVLLMTAGGLGGLLVAAWTVGPLIALSPDDLGMAGGIRVDLPVLLFGIAVSIVAGVCCGLAPARQLVQVNLHDDLKQTARGGSGVRQQRMRAALVSAEVALSLVLLVGAGLTIKSLIQLERAPAGFDPDRVLTLSIGLPQGRYPTPPQKGVFWERAIEALRGVPGIDAVGATSRLPLTPGNSSRGLFIEGLPDSAEAGADYRVVTPDYFRALRIPLVRGRFIEPTDRAGAPRVAVISASMAQAYWPGRDVVGQRFVIGDKASASDANTFTIVGIIADIRHASLAATPRPTVYASYLQDPWPSMTFAVRARGDVGAASAALSTAVREAIWRVDKDQPIRGLMTMEARLSDSLQRRRFSVALLSAFGGLAVTLAAIGLFGVLSFVVTQRRREIGVRMALGATAWNVVADVLTQGLKLAGLGIVIGLALAFAATRLLTTMLYGTSATDALTFATVTLTIILIAAGASALPAFRASRVDPLIALKED